MSHAILSPSGASRWLACTPSARLETKFPDSAGEAAAEGTLAHRLGELLIKRKLGRIHNKPYEKELKEILANPLYTTSMMDYCEDYAVFVIEKFHAVQVETPDAELLTEMKVDLGAYVEEGFGTVDIQIRTAKRLIIIDLKYGKGVPVSVIENKQEMLYALGAHDASDFLYDYEVIEMIIYQPRLDNISSWEIEAGNLLAWGREVLIPKAKQAFAGEGDFNPGDHCRFCRAKNTCKALADFCIEVEDYGLEDPALLRNDQIAIILKKKDLIVNWLSGLGDYVLAQALSGIKYDGWKVVEGKSNRVYSNEDKVAEKLLKEGYDDSAIYKKKLLGIGDMEKELGKADFNRYLSDLVIKPAGKPVLVPETDKRPELNSTDSAIKDFS